MNEPKLQNFEESAKNYIEKLYTSFSNENYKAIERLAYSLQIAWKEGKFVYICGNGGSAANALHIANDFHYGIGACGSGNKIPGLKIEALGANCGVITCLANDTGYEHIYSHQLQVKATQGDMLIVLSGSGNSPNVVNALKTAKQIGMESYSIVAFDGGKCKKLSDLSIHLPIEDMQIAEDTQLVVGHICMQWLNLHKPEGLRALF